MACFVIAATRVLEARIPIEHGSQVGACWHRRLHRELERGTFRTSDVFAVQQKCFHVRMVGAGGRVCRNEEIQN